MSIYYDRINQGLCGNCGRKEKGVDRVYCDECYEKKKKRKLEKKQQQLCVDCGNPTGGKYRCGVCIKKSTEYNEKYRTKLKSKKLCVYCRTKTNGARMCETCVFKNAARDYLGDKTRWIELKNIFDAQDSRCDYTGLKITIYEAHLDHIVPRSKGGTNDLNNLHWILNKVNVMKSSISEKDFLNLIEKIYKYKLCKNG